MNKTFLQFMQEASDAHDQAMAHKKQADKAMDKNDLESYHMHMSAHHESMGQWHESKGRQGNADKEYEKAEKHHELGVKKATQKNEEVEGVAEGLVKDIRRLATGKDVKSRAGQEIAKSQDASMKGDNKTAHKHFKRYDKLDKLANEEVEQKKPTLPPHLQKLIKGKQLDKKPMMSAKVKDVTPKGYGPNEEVELDEEASVSVTVQANAPADKKYAVTEIHPRTSPRGRTKWKDVSYHSSAEEAKTAADAHAKKNSLHRMKSIVAEEVGTLDELEQSTVSSYATKAKKDVEELKPFIKKGQSSIAQRIADRRKKGLAMAGKRMSEEVDLEEETDVSKLKAQMDKHFEKAVACNRQGDDAGCKMHKAAADKIKSRIVKIQSQR